MTWVLIGGHRYYRRSRRVAGAVVTEHVGRGRVAELTADLDARERQLRRLDRAAARLDRDAFLLGVADCLAVDAVLGDLAALVATRCGAYRHRRQWRRKRGADIVGALKTMAGDVRRIVAELEKPRANPPLMAPEFDGVPDDDRATLRAAAAGDAAALERARPYLTDPRYTRRWGSPMYAARCWLVSQACGDDRVVARATHNRADQMADELGYREANVLERLAITRVVHNWLMVGAVEARACGRTPLSKERAQIERCLTQAERRLTQAVKTLAFLRSVPPAEVADQLSAVRG